MSSLVFHDADKTHTNSKIDHFSRNIDLRQLSEQIYSCEQKIVLRMAVNT